MPSETSVLTTLSRETLSGQIARRLLQFIAAEGLKAGDLLPSEATLAQRFGVSRPVVREALKSLAGQGVIEIASGKGAMVRPVDEQPLRVFFRRAVQVESDTLVELMEVRKPLEVQSAVLAAQRRTPEELSEIAQTVRAMRDHLHDLDAYTELDVEFHLLVAQATHNAMMAHLISSIRESLRDAIREGLLRRDTEAQLQRVQALHEGILSAIEKEDAQEAGRVMARHFDEAVMALVGPPGAA